MEQSLKPTKPHYELLDGLRGMAAIFVVIFHAAEILITDPTKNPVAHGFLAVDFFFCLSGFVIAYAYDDRIGTIGLKKFFLNRLIRLHPLVILGSIIGVLALLWAPFETVSPVTAFGWTEITIAFLCSILMIPYPALNRFGNVFPLNAPSWSLSMEYFINVVYALVLVRLSKHVLLVLLSLSAIALVWVAYYRGNIMGGWGDANYIDGYARVSFSFILGLVIFRYRLIIANKLHFLVYALLLSGIFLVPHLDRDWLTEVLLVILIFPILIALAAGAPVSGAFRKVCVRLGELSYPLYMLHYWMMWILIAYVNTTPGESKLYQAATLIVLSSIIFSYVLLKVYDEPVRKWLNKKKN